MSSPIAGTAVTVLGIAGPALLMTAAVLRWLERIRWRFPLLFLALVLLFLGRAVFTSDVPVPVDEVAQGYPYRGIVGPVVAANPLTNDTVKQFLPWMQVVREELSHGRFPLWNRYAFSGYPLLGNGQSAPFSPLFLATLFVPLPKQIVAMAGLKLFVALLFSYLFCRRQKLSDGASCFAAIAFAFSTSQTVYLYYSTVSVTAFLPAALYAVALARRDPANEQDRGAFRWPGCLLMTLVVGTIMANGHPESVLHIAIGTAAWMLIDGVVESDRRRWLSNCAALAAAAVAGLLIAAPVWVPTLEQVLLSERLTLLRHARYAPFPLTALWALVAPNGFGNPVRHNWSWILNYSLVAYSYIGLVPLGLVITATVSRGTPARVRWLLAASGVLFVVAMDWTFLGHAVNRVPPFSIAANDKLRFVSVFFALVAAAGVLDRWGQYSRVILTAAGGSVAALATYAYWKHASLMRPLDLVGAASVLVFAWIPRAAWAAVLTGFELFVLNAPFNAAVPARYSRPSLPIIAALGRLAPREPFRIVGLDWTFLPNAAAQYGLEDIRGSDPMALETYMRFFQLIEVEDPTGDVRRVVDVDKPAVDFLNVRFVLGEPGTRLSARWRLVYDGADGTLFERNQPIERFFVPSTVLGPNGMSGLSRIRDFRREVVSDIEKVGNGPATITAIEGQRPDRFRLRVGAGRVSFIATSEPLAPGWRVEVGRVRAVIHPVDGAFIGFFVPRGVSEVTVTYRPRSFYRVWPAAIVGALVLFGLWFGGRRGARGGSPSGRPSGVGSVEGPEGRGSVGESETGRPLASREI
jgi:hypothetical protein